MTLTLRSSGLDQLFACNGSWLAQSLVPARESEDGHEGSLIHFLIAQRLILELGATPPLEGLQPPRLTKGYKLPAFSAWIVDWAVRHVRDTVPEGWILQVEIGLAYEFLLPRPVWIPVDELGEHAADYGAPELRSGRLHVLVNRITLSGHLDVFAQSPDGTECIGLDWKSGVIGADPAEQNWQAASYQVLTKQAWPETQKSDFELCQPRIDEEQSGIPRVSRSTLSGQELGRMADVIIENINKALENRYQTNSGHKQCRYCAVSWRCPSIQAELSHMKATLTETVLAELRDKPRDGALADFVISGRTLGQPIKDATELLHERLDATGYIDADCGVRITRTERPGTYEVPDALGFYRAVVSALPEESVARVMSPSMTALKEEISVVRDVPLKSKKMDTEDAGKIFDREFRHMTNQSKTRILILT